MTHLLTAEQQLLADAAADGVEKFVVGAVVHRDGQVLILRRTADDFLSGIEELPSGGVDPGEEIGWQGPVDPDPGFVTCFDYVSGSGRRARQWTVSVNGAGQNIALSDEHTAYRWIAPADVEASDLTPESIRVINAWAAAQL